MRLKFAMTVIARGRPMMPQGFAGCGPDGGAIGRLSGAGFCEHHFTVPLVHRRAGGAAETAAATCAAANAAARCWRKAAVMPSPVVWITRRTAPFDSSGARHALAGADPRLRGPETDAPPMHGSPWQPWHRPTAASLSRTPTINQRADWPTWQSAPPAFSSLRQADAYAIASSASSATAACWARSKRSRAERMAAWFSPAQLSSCEIGSSSATPSLDKAYSTLGGLVA